MKSARRRSRELATQGLYQWLLSGSPAGEIDAQLRGAQGFDKADHEHLDAILNGVIRDSEALSAAIAPFDVVITPVSITDAALRAASEELYESCRKMDLDSLLDDRDERPGVKFKDADLTGIPYRITIGKKLAEGMVEVVDRRSKKREDVDKDYAAAFIAGKARL